MEKLSEHSSRNFIYCDVSARWGLEEPWKSYRDFIDVISFEPDKKEFDELLNNKMNSDLVLPFALYKEEKQVNLNLTKLRGCSSIYEPNHSFLSKFPDIERFKVEEKIEVKATTLDNLYIKKELQKLDFIKLDTQGAELDILRGGVT
jgi:FkbM family methyltransferase